MNITYLLGAGASYNAVPIVGELNRAFIEVSEFCKQQFPHSISESELRNGQKLFDAHMITSAHNAEIFGTIDTYAKKLFLTADKDLEKLKAALSFFFTAWQDIDKMHFTETRKESRFQNVDKRYLGLLANYLYKKDGILALNEDVNFITWNYDTQLERAIALFNDKTLDDVLKTYKIYPYNLDSIEITPQIVHLNGIAGLYKETKNEKTIKTTFNNGATDNVGDIFKVLLSFMDLTEKSKLHHAEYFTYAWEDDQISKAAISHSEKIMNNTDVLVIIGYSFPTFNDVVDKRLFQALKKVQKIYYQDPNANEELFSVRFGVGLDKNRIKIVENVDQFVLPLDFNTAKPKMTIY